MTEFVDTLRSVYGGAAFTAQQVIESGISVASMPPHVQYALARVHRGNRAYPARTLGRLLMGMSESGTIERVGKTREGAILWRCGDVL